MDWEEKERRIGVKPETIEVIRKRLTSDLEQAEAVLLRQIQLSGVGGISPGTEEKIREYRKAYDILKDFEDWAEEQEDE